MASGGENKWNEKLHPCPYIPDHHIRAERFGYHLLKCRKALEKSPTSPYFSKVKDLKICRWNQQHHIHHSKIVQHEQQCSDNLNAIKIHALENDKSKASNVTKNITPITTKQLENEKEDDWNDDSPTYNPTEIALKLNILPPGLTPSQRAKFRYARRINQLPDFLNQN